MKQSDVDKKMAANPPRKYVNLPLKKKAKKAARPKKGFFWERAHEAFAGTYVTPKVVSKKFKLDRAYACRVLQSLVKKGYASKGAIRGEYKIHNTPGAY